MEGKPILPHNLHHQLEGYLWLHYMSQPPTAKDLLGGCGRHAWQPESVSTGSEYVWLLAVSWGSGGGCLAARAEAPFGEKLKLLKTGGAMNSLASWVGLHTWSWRGRHWPRVPEMLNKTRGEKHGGTGS